MPEQTQDTSNMNRELILTRLIDAPREKLFRAWTEPELLKQWFTPRPWTTPVIETDVRPGGSSFVLMRGPDGTEFPNRGVYVAAEKASILRVKVPSCQLPDSGT
jgi:uncharacterized protein YndB with AHSA1/START domain